MLTLFHHPLCPRSRYVRLILGEYGTQNFDGGAAVDLFVNGFIDLAHAAGANQRLNAIGSEPGTWRKHVDCRVRDWRDAD